MGYFATLIVDELGYQDEQVTQSPKVLRFEQDPYVSWMSEDPPPGDWDSLARETIFVKNPVAAEIIEYDSAEWVTRVNVRRLVRPRVLWEYRASFHNMDHPTVYHVLLPKSSVPNSFGLDPDWIKEKRGRISLTWVVTEQPDILVRFTFSSPDNETFARFAASLKTKNRLTDPSTSRTLREISRKVHEEGRKWVAEVVVRMSQQG